MQLHKGLTVLPIRVLREVCTAQLGVSVGLTLCRAACTKAKSHPPSRSQSSWEECGQTVRGITNIAAVGAVDREFGDIMVSCKSGTHV